jgi:hypothetical protein
MCQASLASASSPRRARREPPGGRLLLYTVDEKWLVPHLEKMLYDNAQLLELLALAHADQRFGRSE